MLTRSLLIRIAGPTVFVSLLFLGSCVTAAIYLHHQQSASVRVLDEAIASRRIAGDLLKALDDLAALPMDRRDEAGAMPMKDPTYTVKRSDFGRSRLTCGCACAQAR